MLHSIVGWGSTVGRWARVEGTPNDPNPNDPRAHMDSESLFKDGKLLPAITILGMASQGTQGCEKPPQVMGGLSGENLCLCEGVCVCFPLANIYQVPAVCQALCASLGAWGQGTDGQGGIPPNGSGSPASCPWFPLPMASSWYPRPHCRLPRPDPC